MRAARSRCGIINARLNVIDERCCILSERMRGTSVAPIVLGLVGGVLDIPSALCVGACYAGIAGSALQNTGVGAEAAASAFGGAALAILVLGVVGGIISIIFGCLSKRNPTLSGIMMIISSVMVFAVVLLSAFSAVLSIAGAICSLVGGILALVQEKVPA